MTPVFVITVGDIVGFGVIALIVIGAVIYIAVKSVIQALCKHNGGVNETGSCYAICRKCGKSLGFIGTWRNKK